MSSNHEKTDQLSTSHAAQGLDTAIDLTTTVPPAARTTSATTVVNATAYRPQPAPRR